MLMFFYLMNWMFSIIFIFLNHPLSLGSILLIQTIIISLSSGFFYFNFWFSYILFLIMIGGMMIMFIYMTSIASNEKFKIPHKNFSMIFMVIMILNIILMILLDPFFNMILNMLANLQNQSLFNLKSFFPLNKFYNMPCMKFMIILMIYLFMTLIAVVKIIGKNFGTLRQK